MDLLLIQRFPSHKTLSGLLVDVFINCLNSHCRGTHSQQRMHWWASDVMVNFFSLLRRRNKLIDKFHIGLSYSFIIEYLQSSVGVAFMHTSSQYGAVWAISVETEVMGDCPLMDVVFDLSLWPYPEFDAQCKGGEGVHVWVAPLFHVVYLKAPWVLRTLSLRRAVVAFL